MRAKLFLLLFFSCALIDVFAISTANNTLRFIFKPLIVISLLAYYLFSEKKPQPLYVAALIFCFLGDVFLLFSGSNFFIVGLLSFLIAHIFYIIMLVHKNESLNFKSMYTASTPFILFFAVFISVLDKHLDEMVVPVLIYAIVICSMGIMTLHNYLLETSKSNTLFLGGASIFIISDSLIAIDKFLYSNVIFSVAIMVTYVIAQYLICKAVLCASHKVT